ncbi:16S rRNA (cytosine(1402)-N(4))-methyltransferase RsmH [Enterobacterales bacterium endosymbiont of Anomoneura mori]|uniref:16S rRNA (cytosine(1402)-N(4))-methyltransferase RsmH n=1 Tax=Enterobacterales bacterium endosymbiont of Anomoneura mori TaxID=3132096 RepID=UPI00399D099F
MKKKYHISVLLKESIENLNIKKNGIYIDSTFGCGGHSKMILSKLGKKGKLFSFDKDPKVIYFINKIKDKRFFFINQNFSNLHKIKLEGKINGILFDLGLSSFQLDDPKRGFSFINNGPLDMRMNQKEKITALKWIKSTNIKKLNFVLKNFGEEKNSKRLAKAIYEYNKVKPINNTKELSNLIKLNYNQNNIKNKHPATRSFQAIRIYINNELKELECALKYSLKLLSNKGRISIISYHSLEDRIVKNFIKFNNIKYIKNNKNIKKNKLKFIGKFRPSLFEIKNNYRSRSAILRIAEKI